MKIYELINYLSKEPAGAEVTLVGEAEAGETYFDLESVTGAETTDEWVALNFTLEEAEE